MRDDIGACEVRTDDEGEVEAVHSATSLRSGVCCGSMDSPLLRT